jgi:hypothetical protein
MSYQKQHPPANLAAPERAFGIVPGAIYNASVGRGTRTLKRRVDVWAARLNLSPRVARVQRMTRKWGLVLDRGDDHAGGGSLRARRRLPGFRHSSRTATPARADPPAPISGTVDPSPAELTQLRCRPSAPAFGKQFEQAVAGG